MPTLEIVKYFINLYRPSDLIKLIKFYKNNMMVDINSWYILLFW